MALIPRAASSFIHYEQIPFIVFTIILMVITLLSTCFGIHRRISVSGKLLVEDVFALLATIAALALSSTFTIDDDLNDGDNLEIIRKVSVVALYSYIAAVLFLRTSFLLLYLRLDRRIIMRWIVLALSPVVLTQTCSLVIGAAFSCAPPTLIWTTSIASSGRCWTSGSIQTFLNVSGILVSAVDASILAASLSMAGTRRGLRLAVSDATTLGLSWTPIIRIEKSHSLPCSLRLKSIWP
ncbi:uncharacterized protein MYCGRDRAFT_91840 [Zymoseptoria tritici IPO323]|uniref:Rhodopsin domain-containing protein n=1 Tax=Zymoseptoria tritici (strain CBS 115943 / IPO323) TaxID=336722 RepID=F9X6X4_ZYMTI|nr:uncharacterized protein MYCGRDRAFT_91840 [Zymoseptoria tritici IPO323]EGP88893.1 hypothetical protein MYCGRDRAFT_91840 [Zymoseptoria tritici IPO323]